MPSEPGGFVVRDHSAAAPPVARTTPRARTRGRPRRRRPTQRPSAVQQRGGARALEDVDRSGARRRARTGGGRRGGRSRCRRRGRRGAREWPPSRPSARLPWRSASKRTPSRSRSRDVPRRLAAQDGGGARADEPAAGALGVLAVLVGRVVDARAPRRCRPAPSSWRSARAGSRSRARRARPSARGGQRGVEAGARRRRRRRRRPRCGARRSSAGTVPACRGSAPLRHPSSLRPRHRRAPRARRRGSRRSRRSSSAATGSGWDVRESPAVERARRSRPCIPAGYVQRIESLCAARRRAPRHGHRSVVAASWEARAARGRRRRRAWSTRCSAARRASARSVAPAARPSRRAGAGDGLLPVQQHRGRGAARARRARRSSAC